MPPDLRDAVHASAVRARPVATAQAAIVTPRYVWLRGADAELVVRSLGCGVEDRAGTIHDMRAAVRGGR
jgi:hypothetical protein